MQAQKSNPQLNSQILTNCSEIVGVASFSQYLYVFSTEKIAIYQHLSSKTKPELMEEILLPKKQIKLFDISQDFIAVVFVDGDLEVRKRGQWSVMIYSDRLHPTVDQLEISGEKIIYRYKEDESKIRYVLIDTQKKIQQRFWDKQKTYQKLIYNHQLATIPDFYIGINHEKKVEFGMLYEDEVQILKNYEFGVLPCENNSLIKDIFMHKIDRIHWLIQIFQTFENNQSRLSVQIKKFYEESQHTENKTNPKNNSFKEKQIQIFQEMLEEMQQIQKNMDYFSNGLPPPQGQSENEKVRKKMAFNLKNENYQNSFIVGNELWLCAEDTIHQIKIGDEEEPTNLPKGKQRLLGISEKSLIYQSKCLMIQSEAEKQIFENNHVEAPQEEVKHEEKEVPLINGFKLRQLSLSSEVYSETIVAKKQENKVDKKILRSKKHEARLHELSQQIGSISSYFQKNILKNVNEYVKDKVEQTKELALIELKKFLQNILEKELTPAINEKVEQVMSSKFKQINNLISELATRNMVNLNEEIQKQKCKEEMMKNYFMHKQTIQINQLKKTIEVIVDVCKKRQAQKIVLFDFLKNGIEKLTKRVVTLQQKVDEFAGKEEIMDSRLMTEIEIIKGMMKSKHIGEGFESIDNEEGQKYSEEYGSEEEEYRREMQNSDESSEEFYMNRKHPPRGYGSSHSKYFQMVPSMDPYFPQMQYRPYYQSIPNYYFGPEMSMPIQPRQYVPMNDYPQLSKPKKKRSKKQRKPIIMKK